MKAIVICKEVQTGVAKGAPNIGTDYSGFVHVGDLPGAYAAYVITATAQQLTDIQAHANCVGGAVITEDNTLRWVEMDQPISPALRTKVNTYLTNNSLPTVPAGTTLKQVVKRAANHFDIGTHDVFDPH